jgi:hypothetical protein
MQINLTFSLFLLCPNLTSYRSYELHRAPHDLRDNTLLLNTPTAFPKIQHFEWSFNSRAFYQLQFIRLPGLRYLGLHGNVQILGLSLANFFNSLPKDLQTLHLTCFWDGDLINDLLVCIPQLTTLILERCNGQVFTHVVGLLEPASSPRMAASTLFSDLLPNLRTLRIEAYGSHRMGNGFSDCFARALTKRMEKMTVDREFQIEILPASYVRWSSQAKKMLKDLVMHDGASLRIFNGDKEMMFQD